LNVLPRIESKGKNAELIITKLRRVELVCQFSLHNARFRGRGGWSSGYTLPTLSFSRFLSTRHRQVIENSMGKSGRENDEFTLFHLETTHEGQTVSSALRQLMGGASWKDVRAAIASRRVQINGNLCLDEARRLTAKDVIKLWKQPLAKPVASNDVKIVYADEFLVVVEKPPGVTSVRHFEERTLSNRRRQLQPTLDELLPDSLRQFLARQTSSNYRPLKQTRKQLRNSSQNRSSSSREKGPKLTVIPVHRLDRETSGLMLFARDKNTAISLNRMFRKHTVDRRYQAVVLGDFKAATFDTYLVRDRGDGIRGSAKEPIPEDAQRAITHARPMERLGEFTIVECKLQTGRTHQIRIHLSEAGHMLCGEPIYNRNTDGNRIQDNSQAPRQALHAYSLQLIHPMTQEKLSFKMAWPRDLENWIERLRDSLSKS
jgi:23S rRNA pseudouridine1911/1915/1917 synthase